MRRTFSMKSTSTRPAIGNLTASSPARTTLSLDGEWEIGESLSAAEPPASFQHRGPVPGLVNLAQPPFPHVDEFESYELNATRISRHELPESARSTAPGISRQPRNYFWYRRRFRAPARRAAAFLVINKAQFGTAVWLNGRPLGEEAGCFTASRFPLTAALAWERDNELLIRIGAHPGVLPANFPAGTDFEKLRWTPGLYDRVTAIFCDDPVIESVQVAPRLAPSSIEVQTRVKNHGPASCALSLVHEIATWRDGRAVARGESAGLRLEPGEERIFTDAIAIPDAHPWSPEDPFLYVVDSHTGGDVQRTRFGLREFRSDAATGRFYLNGRPCHLRGSNIALHRFFEDPACGALPWDEAWVRKLLGEIPRKMHWNAFRFSIGPVPAQWLDLADEFGLLIQNEFFVWTGHPKWRPNYARHWDAAELTRQFSDWMRDHWNHPSVVIWDACNETFDPVFGEKVIPAVRSLDLSDRPWDNGYNPPAAPDDPVEIHPYLHASSYWNNALEFQPAMLATKTFDDVVKLGSAEVHPGPHPYIINEYGWLWLNRDGTPTALTDKLYTLLLGDSATAEDRLAFYGSMIGMETEFFRASRRFAGILHFVYLTCSFPGAFTSDPFRDVRTLELEPHFADHVAEAFKPLGACLNFYEPTLSAAREHRFGLTLVNDTGRADTIALGLTLEMPDGRVLASVEGSVELAAFGAATTELALAIPGHAGDCNLRLAARGRNASAAPTLSRRRVTVVR
ncbi:MAG TPA: glycoside hydrolase family 2 TIM barrel-domain containing protein [Opitutus sp.]|nr:glycoside hydrolase family 2 TIM barrel-domain containing protein [Opitutus sp.]